MLKLKLQYFGHLIQTDDSLEKSLMLRKIEGRRRRGCQTIRWLDSIDPNKSNSSLLFKNIVKAMVFPVVMYGCEKKEIWTVKKAEHRRLMLLNCGVGEDS